MGRDTTDAKGSPWLHLERHFRRHTRLVSHFRNIGAPDVVEMWKSGRNAAGAPLSRFEREALVERHCELFERWPT
jgi:hypothetical protein